MTTLTLKGPNLGEGSKVLQYPFPVKAALGNIKVNGEEVRAAQTAGKDKQYTYFTINGVDYYVSGHLPFGTEFTLDFPTDYAAKTLKVTRAPAPKKAKAPKANGDATAAPAEAGAPAAETAPAPAAEAPAADAAVANPFAKKARSK